MRGHIINGYKNKNIQMHLTASLVVNKKKRRITVDGNHIWC